jgi:hypothetical protein
VVLGLAIVSQAISRASERRRYSADGARGDDNAYHVLLGVT